MFKKMGAWFLIGLISLGSPSGFAGMQKLSLESYIKARCKTQWNSHIQMHFLRGLSALKDFNRAKAKEDFDLFYKIVKSLQFEDITKDIDQLASKMPQILNDVDYLKHAAFGRRRGITDKMLAYSLANLKKNLSITSLSALAHARIYEACQEMNHSLDQENPLEKPSAERCAPLIRAYPQFLNLVAAIQSIVEDVGAPCQISS